MPDQPARVGVDSIPSTEAWVTKTGVNIDHDALDRMADTIMDAIAARGRGEPQIALRLTALMKVQAMLLARLCQLDGDLGPEAVGAYCLAFSDALAAEVMNFVGAYAKDAHGVPRRPRRAG